MVTINYRIRDELTKDRYLARKHVEWQSSEQSPMAGRLGEKEKELVKKSEWQIEQPVRCLSRRLRRASVGGRLPVFGERLFYMVANQKIVAAINEQMGNEFSAMLQYYAIAAHFGAEGLCELSAHFYKQAEEEKEHALRFIQFVLDTGARVRFPLCPRHRRTSTSPKTR
jgi:ferritin-like protein